MANQIDNIDITSLTIDERTLLAHRLWESVVHEVESTPLTAEQLAELDRRLDDAESGRGSTVPWSAVKAQLLKRLQP